MDALDAMILRQLGMEPFLAWPRRHTGLKLADIAQKMGRNVQFVKDRIGRMEADGVIVGYRLFPNLRHLGLGFTTHVWPAAFVPDKERLSRLGAVDGFVGVFWSLESCLCVDLTAADAMQRERRLELIGELLGMQGRPQMLFDRPFPHVPRKLSPLDWLSTDARRPLSSVAEELGVTPKTVRARYNAMWKEGSIDTYAALDFERMKGIIPFGLSTWHEADGTEARLLKHFQDRYLAHLRPPAQGYCSSQVRIFAFTPAEVQTLVREALGVEGVRRVESFLVTGAFYSDRWLQEALGAPVSQTRVAA